MNLGMRQSPQLALEQRMTPQLILLMELLVRPCIELRAEIAAALADNPALEEAPDPDGVLSSADQIEGAADDARLLDHLEGGVGRDLVRIGIESEVDDSDGDRLDRATSDSVGLVEHLLQQLWDETRDPGARSIGEWIIRNLDANGYLGEDVPVIAARLGGTIDDVAGVLARVQMLHPLGVATRDARECLLLQARVRFPDRPHLARLIEFHLADLVERRYPSIARKLGISIDQVREEERRLRTLNPRPARGFGDDAISYITPDVRIVRVGGELVVRVNDDGLPRLRVCAQFRRILRDARAARPEELTFARTKVAAAKAFIKGIYERQRTIVKVTEAIVDRQREFFESGPEFLRPMVLRDIAADVGLSESTVSRVTSRKYMETPQGLFELKYFFSIGVPGTSGGEIAPEAAKEMIRRIVALEDPGRPLSDQKIQSHLMADHGVRVARRTVAKYRENLGIWCSSRRRRRGKDATFCARPSR